MDQDNESSLKEQLFIEIEDLLNICKSDFSGKLKNLELKLKDYVDSNSLEFLKEDEIRTIILDILKKKASSLIDKDLQKKASFIISQLKESDDFQAILNKTTDNTFNKYVVKGLTAFGVAIIAVVFSLGTYYVNFSNVEKLNNKLDLRISKVEHKLQKYSLSAIQSDLQNLKTFKNETLNVFIATINAKIQRLDKLEREITHQGLGLNDLESSFMMLNFRVGPVIEYCKKSKNCK